MKPDDDTADLTDSAIELLLEDARLGGTVASVTLVEACETALGGGPQEAVANARRHIIEYLGRGGRHDRPRCRCGHGRTDHDMWGGGPCVVCQCPGFRGETAGETDPAAPAADQRK